MGTSRVVAFVKKKSGRCEGEEESRMGLEEDKWERLRDFDFGCPGFDVCLFV
jgi:hypothetical protein